MDQKHCHRRRFLFDIPALFRPWRNDSKCTISSLACMGMPGALFNQRLMMLTLLIIRKHEAPVKQTRSYCRLLGFSPPRRGSVFPDILALDMPHHIDQRVVRVHTREMNLRHRHNMMLDSIHFEQSICIKNPGDRRMLRSYGGDGKMGKNGKIEKKKSDETVL